MQRRLCYLCIVNVVIVFFIALGTGKLVKESQIEHLDANIVSSSLYREQNIGENFLEFLKTKSNPGTYAGIYLLESNYGYEKFDYELSSDAFQSLEKKWSKNTEWNSYIETTNAIWNDVKYFPVPEFTNAKELIVSYVNTWMSERTYGGKRGHEGCDLMASKNERGLYPIISMTDGIVLSKGWLEKGGYRIGIKSPGGAYFYYAHLDSYANLEEGDTVKAGDILGFMGDSGYGPEGTVGQFAVHLHLGIYIYPNEVETSINPYWILRYIENRMVKCYTEK